MSSRSLRGEPVGPLRPVAETLAAMVAVSAAFWAVGVLARPLAASLFVLSSPTVAHPWTLLTSVYAHAGVPHLLANAVVIVVAGVPVAAGTTRLRFHLFVLGTGALAGLAQVWGSGLLSVHAVGVLGTSGAAFALVGYVAAANLVTELLAAVADRAGIPPWAVVLGVAAFALAAVFVFSAPGSALVAHLAGLALGLIAGRVRLLRV